MSGVSYINGKRVATPEYRSWQMMKNRCLNPRAMDYAFYGARGITIDPRWLNYSNFLIDMGPRPTTKHTLERVNNALGYYKANCVWATRLRQARNRPQYNKLTKQKADHIRQLYATGKYRQIDLAHQFGVCQRTISVIVRNEGWR